MAESSIYKGAASSEQEPGTGNGFFIQYGAYLFIAGF